MLVWDIDAPLAAWATPVGAGDRAFAARAQGLVLQGDARDHLSSTPSGRFNTARRTVPWAGCSGAGQSDVSLKMNEPGRSGTPVWWARCLSPWAARQ